MTKIEDVAPNISTSESLKKSFMKKKEEKDEWNIKEYLLQKDNKTKSEDYIYADFIIDRFKNNKKESLTLDEKEQIVIFREDSYEKKKGTELILSGIFNKISNNLEVEIKDTLRKKIIMAMKVNLKPDKKNFNKIMYDIDEKKKYIKPKEKEVISPEANKIANDIIMNGDPIKFIRDTHATMHVGDDALTTQLLVSIGIQSVNNSAGIHPKVSGESGKGKSHCCKAMAHLIPKEYILMTTLSDMAIYYVDIEPGSIVFSDDADPSEALVGVIKRATTNFQEGDKRTTLDKNLNQKELFIPPRIVWWLTSVDADQSMQLLNRQFGGDVDETIEQDKKVHEFQKMLARTGRVDFPENQDVEVCRAIIRELKNHLYNVIIPFVDDIIWHDIDNRRNFPIFQDIIMAFTVLRHMQREKSEDGITIYSNEQDFDDALSVYAIKEINQTTKLTNAELEFLEVLKDGVERTSLELQLELNISKVRVSQLLHGKDGRTGLLSKVPGLAYEKSQEPPYNKLISLIDFNISGSYVCQIALKNRMNKNIE